MLKKLLIFVFCVFPIMVNAAQKVKKEEPVVHLTDEQIYTELKKLASVFEIARDKFVEEADERKMLEGAMNGMLAALDPLICRLKISKNLMINHMVNLGDWAFK